MYCKFGVITPGYPDPTPSELLNGETQSFKSSIEIKTKLGLVLNGVEAFTMLGETSVAPSVF